MTATDWRDRALCCQVGPSFFFPEEGESTRQAKRICAACPVRTDCLTEGISQGDSDGVRAGFDMYEVYAATRAMRGRLPARSIAREVLKRDAHAAH